jgi:transposase-like protein
MEAVQLLQTSQKPLAQIARDLGIAESTLHQWRKLFSEQGANAFPGSGIRPHKKRKFAISSEKMSCCGRSAMY